MNQGKNSESSGQEQSYRETLSNDSDERRTMEKKLLEQVISETMGSSNQAALDLVYGVARASKYPDTTHIEAVEEIVEAVFRHSFPNRRFPRRLVHRVALSLSEAPEATTKLEKLWREARCSE